MLLELHNPPMPSVFPTDRKSAHSVKNRMNAEKFKQNVILSAHTHMFTTAQIYLELQFCVEPHAKKSCLPPPLRGGCPFILQPSVGAAVK